jgi:uncharacterized protein YijF (DUF1287 family)
MHPFAVWTATLTFALYFGDILNWRLDAALTISLGVVIVALRARISDEQVVVLGLADG